MGKQRQDAWKMDEDTLLAEIVLRHIRDGKTQLEAFTQAAHALSRTAAACGYRWNASLRKQYEQAIDEAKHARREQQQSTGVVQSNGQYTIDDVIAILEQMKSHVIHEQEHIHVATLKKINHLEHENRRLQVEVKRYREAWHEMNHLWNWIKNSNEH